MLLIRFAQLLLALASFPGLAPQSTNPVVWTGKASADAVPTPPTEKDAVKLAGDLRHDLESLKTQTEVRRDFAKKLPTLDSMRAVANWRFAYPGKAALLAEIAEVRADWLEKLGRHADAVFAAQHPLVLPEEQSRPPYDAFEWTEASPSIATLITEIDALPKMIDLRKRFPENAPAAQSTDAIENVVWDAIERGNPATLMEFGTRCVPALQKITLARKDEENRLTDQNDPLTILLALDRRAGQAFFLSTLDTRGPVWMLRVIRALNVNRVTADPWTFSTDRNVPPTFGDAQTLQLIDALAAKPMTSELYFQLLNPLVARDVVSPAVQAYLVGQVQTSNSFLLGSLRDMLDGKRVGPNKRALYEAFLDSTDPGLRARCAQALSYYPVSQATLRATQHTDPNVRSKALRALVRHSVWSYDYGSGNTPENSPPRWIEVPRTPEISAALLRLARDPETNVRVELAHALQLAKEEPPADVLELLLTDSDPVVRQVTAYDWSFKPELQARVLERLASDKEPQVLRAVGFALNARSSSDRQVPPEESQLKLPTLAKWLANPGMNASPDANAGPRYPIQRALESPEGARMIFDVCIRGPRKDMLAPVFLDAVEWERDQRSSTWMLDSLEPPRIAELFAAACTYWNPQAIGRAQGPLFAAVARGDLAPQAFVDLARDERQSRSTRLRALRIAAPKAGEEFKQCLFELLRTATPAELESGSPACRDFLNLLADVLKVWPEQELVRAEACRDPKLPDSLAVYLAGFGYAGGALDAAATKACLQRWTHLDADWRHWDKGIFYFLDPRIEPSVLELWRAHYRDPQLSDSVVSAMGKYPVDESVPLLGECVVAKISDAVNATAIGALTTRLDDLGADALLKAIAAAPYEGIRKQCFDGLEQIRKYQDEKQSWQKRKGGEAARDQAINDLIPMLSDKDAPIRAAAARSLATLSAAEHLPKLVALLKDKDASVREAAQKALDALNGAGAKKP